MSQNSFAFASSAWCNFARAVIRRFFNSSAGLMWIADGITSLVDCHHVDVLAETSLSWNLFLFPRNENAAETIAAASETLRSLSSLEARFVEAADLIEQCGRGGGWESSPRRGETFIANAFKGSKSSIGATCYVPLLRSLILFLRLI